MQGLGKTVQTIAFLAALLGKTGGKADSRPAWQAMPAGATKCAAASYGPFITAALEDCMVMCGICTELGPEYRALGCEPMYG